MHKRTPARPALPWAKSIALVLSRERFPNTGVSKPKNAASVSRPAEMFPNSPAGMASPIGQPLSMMTTISRVPSPSKICRPTSTGLRLPRQRRPNRMKPRAMVPKGNRINGMIDMSAPCQNHEKLSFNKDNLQITLPAMSSSFFVDVVSMKPTPYPPRKRLLPYQRAGLPEQANYRKLECHYSLPKNLKSANVSSLELNANKRALTS